MDATGQLWRNPTLTLVHDWVWIGGRHFVARDSCACWSYILGGGVIS